MNSFGVNGMVEVDGALLTILGVSAGILILTGWVEQVYKGYKTKSMKDISKFFNDIHRSWINIMASLRNNSVRCIHHRHKHCRIDFNDYCFSNEKKISKYS